MLNNDFFHLHIIEEFFFLKSENMLNNIVFLNQFSLHILLKKYNIYKFVLNNNRMDILIKKLKLILIINLKIINI